MPLDSSPTLLLFPLVNYNFPQESDFLVNLYFDYISKVLIIKSSINLLLNLMGSSFRVILYYLSVSTIPLQPWNYHTISSVIYLRNTRCSSLTLVTHQ